MTFAAMISLPQLAQTYQSFSEHSVTVCGDGDHFKTYRSDASPLLKRINKRSCLIDTNTFVVPNCPVCEPLPHSNSTLALRVNGKKTVTFSSVLA